MIHRPRQVVEQHGRHVAAEALAHHDAQDRHVLDLRRHGVGRHLPAALAELVGEVEDAEARTRLHPEREHRNGAAVAQELEVPHRGDASREEGGRITQRFHDAAVAGAPQAQEVVVLPHHLVSGPREVEREGRHVAAEVVHVKDQIGGQLRLVAPHHPPDAGIDQPVLVAAHVDRLHERQPEIPGELRVQERCDEPAAGGVDVDGHLPPGLPVLLHEGAVQVLDGLVLTRVGGAEDADDPDRALVDEGQGGVRRGDEAAARERHVARLDVPVAAELLPHHLDVRSHHQVGTVARQPRPGAPLAPLPLEGQAGQHDRLARAHRRRADAAVGRVEEA